MRWILCLIEAVAKLSVLEKRTILLGQRVLQLPLIVFCLIGCSPSISDSPAHRFPMQTIKGRNEGNGKRVAIYRLRVPPHWIRRDPLPDESLEDTKKALCDFFIYDGSHVMRIAIHNFPSSSLAERIPPSAQIARWKKQFENLNQSLTHVTPIAFSGYAGLQLSAVGMQDGQEVLLLGWSLQLADEHYRTLSASDPISIQKRADVTIKAVGPRLMMEKFESEIVAAARSFELIEEISSQP